MEINGNCYCGKITYKAELNPQAVGICHCHDCQELSASAFRTVGIVEPGAFELLSGIPKEYIKTGESGNRRVQAFCGDCGSGIYASAEGDEPKAHNVRLGTVKERAMLSPQFQIWCQSKIPWLKDIDTPSKAEKHI